MIVVAKDGSGDVNTISEAIDLCTKNEKKIYIKNGFYFERVSICKEGIQILGESPEKTIISSDLGAYEILEDGLKRGTFRTFTMLIDAPNVELENVTIENTAGPGTIAGQAIALYAEGDGIKVKNCRLLGNQDTLFTGPLPPVAYEERGFIGPKEYSPRINGTQVYEKCFIRGDIDFIFGSATAIFDECEIFSNDLNREINGYIAAPSTPEGQKYGFTFNKCKFTSEAKANTVYLARPWRNFAKSVYIECSYGAHIHESGFDDWGKEDVHETIFFAEYKCNSKGIVKRNSQLCSEIKPCDIKQYSIEKIIEESKNE